jgi:hypothetical protein
MIFGLVLAGTGSSPPSPAPEPKETAGTWATPRSSTSKCRYGDLTQFGTINQGDLAWLRQDVLEPLNKTIEESAGTQDAASFVDAWTAIPPCDLGESP